MTRTQRFSDVARTDHRSHRAGITILGYLILSYRLMTRPPCGTSLPRCVVCLFVLNLIVLGGTGRTSGRSDTVVIGMAQEPDTLGRFSVMSAARVVENALFAYVAPYTDRWIHQPVLVEQLPTLANGMLKFLPDRKMRVSWRVRRGFTWHDGHPVTALDFRFTYGMLRNPLTPGVSRFVLNKIDYVLLPDPGDPYSLVVQWKEPYPFAGSLPFGEQVIFPRHLLEPAYLKNPTKLPSHEYWHAPVGNGPYRFVTWVPGSHLILEAYKAFPLGAPKVRQIVFRFILDATALQLAVMAGQVDASEINNFGIDQMIAIERQAPPVFTHYTPSLRWERIGFNLDNEWLKDRRVRLAIAYAVDRETLVRALFAGKEVVAHSWLAPRHPAYHQGVKRYPYDPARARALLAEAGFILGPDGILRDGRGQRVEMSLMTTAGHAVRERVAEVVHEQLRAVGIDLHLDNRPASVFIGVITRRRQFPHLALWSTLYSLESTGYEGFHSSQIPSEANHWEGFNVTGWRNPENDRLLEQIAVELDETHRIGLLKRQQEIFADDLPALPLYFVSALTTSRRSLLNVRPTGLFGSFLPWNAYEWSWQE